MVVSEIGEMWSPQTAPDRQAATVIISMVDGASPNTAIAIGIRMLNVPQEVPVANARPSAMRKNTAGMNIPMVDSAFTTEDTKPPMLRYSSRQTPDSVHASVRMRMAGTIALKPSVKASQNWPKDSTLRGMYSTKVNSSVKNEPSTSAVEESQFANASTMFAPSRMPPVYSMPAMQSTISTLIGRIRS